MRSAMDSASSWSWVTRMVVIPYSRCRRFTSICISRRRFLSSAPNGSSSSSTFGSVARQRASATRCCWPPESCRGLRVANSLMWTSARHLGGARSNALARPFVRLEAVGDVLGDRHVREQCVVLEYDAGAAPAWRQMVDGFAVEQHAAAALADEAGDDAQQRGLAAAGGA